MNGIKLSESLKILISMVVSSLLGISFIADNFVVFLFTALLAVLFLISVVIFNPTLFVCVFLSLSYPVSLTIGKLGINNLGLSCLLIFSLLSTAVLFMRKNFSIDKKRLKNILPFLPIIIVVVLSSFYGFIRSGNDSLEILVKFFVFGVFPALFVTIVPFEKDIFFKIIDMTYYIVLSIFGGFTIAYMFFKIVTPSDFMKFFLTFDNPIGTSLFMIQFILVSAIYLKINRDISITRKVFIYGTIFTALFFVVSAFQRSFLIAIAAAVIYYILSTYRIGLKMVLIIALSSILFGTVLYNITLIINSENIKKVEKTIELAEKLSENKDVMRVKEAEELGTIGYRIIKIIASIRKIKERPYFGNGLGTFSNYAGYKYPHNIFIEFLYSSGFIGFFTVIVFFGYVLARIQTIINKIESVVAKTVSKYVMSFIVLCIFILQFSGGIMNIFPYVFFCSFLIFQLLSIYSENEI